MQKLYLLARLVKLEHTVFALPFAYAGMVLGAGSHGVDLTITLVLWVTAAMVGARSLAMGLNRIIDAKIDAQNPRTTARELPSGLVSRAQVWLFCGVSLGLLIVATTQLAPVTMLLWPIPVALFVLYPYTKRFTWMCHAVLGLSIGLAPLGAWIATGASVNDAAPWLLWIGIACWIGGFDVIYATQDLDFDKAHQLHSLPVRFGVHRSLQLVKLAHLLTILCFFGVAITMNLGLIAWTAILIAAALLGWENSIVSEHDLSRIDHAFFTVNSWVGVILGAGLILAHII